MNKIDMQSLRQVFAWLCFLLGLVSCSDSDTGKEEYLLPPAPDYTEAAAWYKVPCAEGGAQADVFYVAPTCVWDWTADDGTLCHFEDVYNVGQREALRPSLELAADIFGAQCDFYAPYYRQITLDSWMEGEDTVARRFPYAMQDVQAAFDHYLKHWNQGRPFVLAGFSQGGKAVVELIKSLPDEVAPRLVAAYVIGYRVTEADRAVSTYLRAAQGATDTGVTVCYNSVAAPDAICPVLAPSEYCINPLNWRTDEVSAALNDTVTVRVDVAHKVLLVEGLDASAYFVSSLGSMFRCGNYHLQELLFYQEALRANVQQRIETFG